MTKRSREKRLKHLQEPIKEKGMFLDFLLLYTLTSHRTTLLP